MSIEIQKNILLAPLTTFKIGGPAKFFIEAENEDEIIEALRFAKKNEEKIFILAGGSNILVSDSGFNGVVIRVTNRDLEVEGNKITCGSGVSLSSLVQFSIENSLSGMEWAAGIPGTVGGAIRGNAGAFGGQISDSIDLVNFISIPDYNLKEASVDACSFGYRKSIFKESPSQIIFSATFKLGNGNREKSEEEINDIIAKRKEKQPRFPSPGSFFQNPEVERNSVIDAFEKSMETKCKDRKVPAGWLIEEVGLKGKSIGGAKVSDEHANFIINTGKATAEDVIILSSLIKQKVRSQFNIQLKEEIQLVGF